MSEKRSSLLLPGAILLGFALVAGAIYLGLTRRPGRDERSAGARAPAPAPQAPAAQRPAPRPVPVRRPPVLRPPAEVHTSRAFADLWTPHRAAVGRTCTPAKQLTLTPKTWHVELPLSLHVTAGGEVRALRLFGKPRLIEEDGRHVTPDVAAGTIEALLTCYRREIRARVRFPAATRGSVVKRWVRILSGGR